MNPGMMMYLLSQPDEEYEGAESRKYQGNRRRQPNQYTRNGMDDDDMPEGAEMRRRRGRDGRYMADDDGMPEDNREYNARNEYRPQPREPGRVENRYMPEYPIIREPRGSLYDGGGIGFGTRDRQYETRSHYSGHGEGDGGQRQTARVGGTMWMEPEGNEPMKLDRMTAERWVHSMQGADPARSKGGRWTMEELKPMAQKMGIEPDPEDEEFLEFYVMVNAMYARYCEVAKKFNITSPEFYGMMAKAWMNDKDAMPGKTALYYRYCVRK